MNSRRPPWQELLSGLARRERRALARCISLVENRDAGYRDVLAQVYPQSKGAYRVGITGPPGAGKSTLVDALARSLVQDGHSVGVVAVDPTSPFTGGALLGDRATMIYSQDDRVFMRSLATRGQAGGLSPATERCLRVIKSRDFDLVLVETVGTGQEAMPFKTGLVDRTVMVISPEYGSRLQLQKIAMLEAADMVVVNKSDLPGAKTAVAEIEQRLAQNRGTHRIVSTMAKRHGDPGVDDVLQKLTS